MYTQPALFRHKPGEYRIKITIDVCGRFEKRPYRDAGVDAGVDAGGYVSRGSGA